MNPPTIAFIVLAFLFLTVALFTATFGWPWSIFWISLWAVCALVFGAVLASKDEDASAYDDEHSEKEEK